MTYTGLVFLWQDFGKLLAEVGIVLVIFEITLKGPWPLLQVGKVLEQSPDFYGILASRMVGRFEGKVGRLGWNLKIRSEKESIDKILLGNRMW